MRAYYDGLKQILRSRGYLAAVLVTALLCYGFAAVNLTVGIDDLEGARYAGDGNALLAAGRFATVLWAVLLRYVGTLPQNSFAIDLIAVAMLVLAAANCCVLFRRISRNAIGMGACTVFSCTLLSYPLIHEIWEYTGANLNVCAGVLLSSFSLLLVHDVVHQGGHRRIKLTAAAGMMMLVCAGYESVVSVYVFLVFALLALQAVYGGEKQLGQMLRQGVVYAAVLAAGLVLRLVVHRLILVVTGLEAGVNGATEIRWGTMPALDIIKDLVFDFVRTYVFKGIIYFPLTELLVAVVILLAVGVLAVRKHGAALLLPGFGMLLSLVLLSIVQGKLSPYRTCQVFGVFVAFVAMIAVQLALDHEWKRVRWGGAAALVLAGFLCLQQSVYLNYFLTLNHVRSEEEAHVIRTIGTALEADCDMTKPVIFVGDYRLSDSVLEAASIPESSLRWQMYTQIYRSSYALLGESYDITQLSRKLPHTNVNSVLTWARSAYGQEAMQNLFAYYGFDYVLADYDRVYVQACAYARNVKMPAYPAVGYIQDIGEYIIVCIGEVTG